MKKLGKEEGPSQQSMPLMLLDEMVRRSSDSDKADARIALLEVMLFSPDGKKELQRIIISG